MEPEQHVDNGWSYTLPEENTSLWPRAIAALEKGVERSKYDPEAAQCLLSLVLFGRTDPKSINVVRSLLLKFQITK